MRGVRQAWSPTKGRRALLWGVALAVLPSSVSWKSANAFSTTPALPLRALASHSRGHKVIRVMNVYRRDGDYKNVIATQKTAGGSYVRNREQACEVRHKFDVFLK